MAATGVRVVDSVRFKLEPLRNADYHSSRMRSRHEGKRESLYLLHGRSITGFSLNVLLDRNKRKAGDAVI